MRRASSPLPALRARLEAKLHALAAHLIRHPHAVRARDLATIDRLTRILKRLEALDHQPSVRRRRWWLAAVLAAATCAVFLLWIDRVDELEIFADLEVEEVTLVLAQDQPVLELLDLDALLAVGDLALGLPPGVAPGYTSEPLTAVDIRCEPAACLSVAGLLLPRDTELILGGGGDGNRLSLQVLGVPLDLNFSADGELTLRGTGRPALDLEIDGPRPLTLRAGAEQRVRLELQPSDDARIELPAPLHVRHLAFNRLTQRGDEVGEMVRFESTLLGGTIVLQEIGDDQIPLRHLESITLGEIEGVIQSLAIEDGRLHLEFRGRATRLEIGHGAARRDMMPTRAAWLHARHSTWLFWGAAIYLFSLIYGFLRWLGVDI